VEVGGCGAGCAIGQRSATCTGLTARLAVIVVDVVTYITFGAYGAIFTSDTIRYRTALNTFLVISLIDHP
jgi:hypothetical protein